VAARRKFIFEVLSEFIVGSQYAVIVIRSANVLDPEIVQPIDLLHDQIAEDCELIVVDGSVLLQI